MSVCASTKTVRSCMSYQTVEINTIETYDTVNVANSELATDQHHKGRHDVDNIQQDMDSRPTTLKEEHITANTVREEYITVLTKLADNLQQIP